MRSRERHQPDDGPDAVKVTPRRLGADWDSIALQLSRLKLRARSLGAYLDHEDPDAAAAYAAIDRLCEAVALASVHAVDLGSWARTGRVRIAPDVLDGTRTPERPLLDRIEVAPKLRAAEAIAPAIAARGGDTGPGWEYGEDGLDRHGNEYGTAHGAVRLCIVVPRDPAIVPSLVVAREGYLAELAELDSAEVLDLGAADPRLSDGVAPVQDLMPLFDCHAFIQTLREQLAGERPRRVRHILHRFRRRGGGS